MTKSALTTLRCLGCGRWNENKCQFELFRFPMSCRANKNNKIEGETSHVFGLVLQIHIFRMGYGRWHMHETAIFIISIHSNFHITVRFSSCHTVGGTTAVGKRVYVTQKNLPGSAAILITYSKHKYNNIRWHARQASKYMRNADVWEMKRRSEMKPKWQEYVISLSASIISSNETVIDLLNILRHLNTFCDIRFGSATRYRRKHF